MKFCVLTPDDCPENLPDGMKDWVEVPNIGVDAAFGLFVEMFVKIPPPGYACAKGVFLVDISIISALLSSLFNH